MAYNRVPNGSNIGQQYNIGDKPTVILYACIITTQVQYTKTEAKVHADKKCTTGNTILPINSSIKDVNTPAIVKYRGESMITLGWEHSLQRRKKTSYWNLIGFPEKPTIVVLYTSVTPSRYTKPEAPCTRCEGRYNSVTVCCVGFASRVQVSVNRSRSYEIQPHRVNTIIWSI